MSPHRFLPLLPLLALVLVDCASEASAVSHVALEPTCDPTAPPTLYAFERSPGGVPEVDATWLNAHRCHVRVVDVREVEELAITSLPFAEHVPLDRVAEEASTWEPDEPIVFVCRSGRRSARATRLLEDMGFERVASLTGGMLGWSATGLPIERHHARAQTETEDVAAEIETAEAGARTETEAASAGLFTHSDIEAHLGDPRRIHWVKAAALLMSGTQSCVDGRAHRPVVGTPGGDAGELLLALAALEEVQGQELDATEVTRLLDAYLDAFGRFYIHSDEHALEGLAHDPRFAASIAEVGLEHFVRHPPHALEPALLSELTSDQHVGCGHLRLILQNPEEYGVRRELTETLLRTVLRRLWQGAAIDFVVLEGDHHEGAVVNVRLDRPVHSFTRLPTVPPRIGDRELFVNHPEASAWLREENAAFLFEVHPWLRDHPDRREEYLETLERMGAGQLQATLTHLAESLPVYEAHVSETGVRIEGPLQ